MHSILKFVLKLILIYLKMWWYIYFMIVIFLFGKLHSLIFGTNDQKSLLPCEIMENVRYFGLFQCRNCGRRWNSGNSWKNCGQKCKHCFDITMPYEMVYDQLNMSKSIVLIYLKFEFIAKFGDKSFNRRTAFTRFMWKMYSTWFLL